VGHGLFTLRDSYAIRKNPSNQGPGKLPMGGEDTGRKLLTLRLTKKKNKQGEKNQKRGGGGKQGKSQTLPG